MTAVFEQCAKSEYSKRKRLSHAQSALGDDVNLMSWDEEKLPRSRADDDEKEMLSAAAALDL